MNIDALIVALEANAERALKPVAVTIDGVGTLHVRRRTVAEFEEMAQVKADEGGGRFAPALARLVCDENGARLSAQHRDLLSAALAKQPEAIFHKLVNAADGTDDKAEAPGN